MQAAPDAMLDDGLLDVLALRRQQAHLPDEDPSEGIQRRSRARAARAGVPGREVVIDADRPFVMYADGDPIGELPVRVRAMRGAVTMIVPAGQRAAALSPLSPTPQPQEETSGETAASPSGPGRSTPGAGG